MNCQMCKDCQRMVGNPSTLDNPRGVSWRCYGDASGFELKKDICVSQEPPTKPPEWCPKRKKNDGSVR